MSPSTPFPEYPTLHTCPMNIARLIDPAIQSWHLGPGLCTRDNLFGVGYLVLLVVNYILAFLALYAVLAVLGRIVCWRAFAKRDMRTKDRSICGKKEWETRSLDRAERGEGGWVAKVCLVHFHILGSCYKIENKGADVFLPHIKAFRPSLNPAREKEKM